MAALEPLTPEILKRYPYFMEWLQELGREPEEVESIRMIGEMVEVDTGKPWKEVQQTDNFTASIVFKNGEEVSRPGKWSDGNMSYVSEEEVKRREKMSNEMESLENLMHAAGYNKDEWQIKDGEVWVFGCVWVGTVTEVLAMMPHDIAKTVNAFLAAETARREAEDEAHEQ